MAAPAQALAADAGLVRGVQLDAGADAAAGREAPQFTPAGQPIPVDGVRPLSARGILRVERAPIAVHAVAGTSRETLFAVRDAAVRALDVLERELHFPLPAPDGVRGGGPELDIYVVAAGPAVETVVDALEYSSLWDAASAFVQVRGDAPSDALDRAVAEGVAQAILLGIDARAARPWRLALAASLAARVTQLGPDLDAMRAFQRDPGAALLANRDDVSARGAAMFVDFLTARNDLADLPLLRRLAWIAIARTQPDQARFADEPDVFDVLGRLFRDQRGGLESMLVDFAVARGLAGSPGDTMGLTAGADDTTLVPDITQRVDSARLPAWVTPSPMLDETGVAYVSVDLSAARERQQNASINLWFHGVPWRKWAVTVVRLDESGRDVGRVPSAGVVRGEWSTTLQELRGVARLLVVVNDFGNGDFDPDDLPDRNGFFALNVSRN